MTNVLDWSARIYGRLLVLYPEDLRRDHGSEMALVFAEDLDAARRQSGLGGVLRVWRCALGETVRFTLPVLAANPVFRVPASAFAFTLAAGIGEMTLAVHRGFVSEPRLLYILSAALVLPLMSTPWVALLSMWLCRGDEVVSLGLSDAFRRER